MVEADRVLAAETEALVDELYRKRLELEDRCVEAAAFEWNYRGSAWTASNKGVASDCVLAKPRPGYPMRMMDIFFVHGTASFAIKKCTEELAKDLATCWCELHSFLLDRWVEAGASSDFDMRRALRDFREGPCFAKVVEAGHRAALARLDVVRECALKT